MYDENFYKYLSVKTEIDLLEITELFEKEADVFKVALTLIEKYNIDEKQLGRAWGDYLGFAYVDPNASIVKPEYISKIGIDFIKKNNVLPLYKFGKAVTVSTSDPANPYIQDKLGASSTTFNPDW